MAKSEDYVVANINYFPALNGPIPTTEWKTRYLGVSDEHTRAMTIRDVRQVERVFNLDTNGFTFIQLPPRERVSASSSEERIRHDYYPELEALAKSL